MQHGVLHGDRICHNISTIFRIDENRGSYKDPRFFTRRRLQLDEQEPLEKDFLTGQVSESR